MLSPNEIAGREYGGDNFAGIFDTIKSGLKAVIPSHTIVGKALSGDYSGAAAATMQLTAKATAPKAVAVPPPGVRPVAAPEDNTMLYVGIGAAVLLGGFLLTRRG